MVKAKKKNVANLRSQRRWWSLFTILLLTISYSGILVVEAATDTRSLYQALGDVQREQDQLLEQSSRLSLERGTLSSLAKVEEIAQQELDMEFPAEVTGVGQ
ncbi:MAG: cell division protein FtsL [Candidatus Azotimanducaceae bacterium]